MYNMNIFNMASPRLMYWNRADPNKNQYWEVFKVTTLVLNWWSATGDKLCGKCMSLPEKIARGLVPLLNSTSCQLLTKKQLIQTVWTKLKDTSPEFQIHRNFHPSNSIQSEHFGHRCHVYRRLQTGFGLVIWFWTLRTQPVTTLYGKLSHASARSHVAYQNGDHMATTV
jgi:hypothetical protein